MSVTSFATTERARYARSTLGLIFTVSPNACKELQRNFRSHLVVILVVIKFTKVN